MSKERINTTLLLGYILLSVLYFYVPHVVKTIVSLVFFSVPTIMGVNCLLAQKKLAKLVGLLVCFFVLTITINLSFSLAGFYIIPNTIMALFLLREKFNIKIIKWSYLLLCSFYISLGLRGLELDTYFNDASRNLISVIILTFVAIIYILEYKENMTFSFWPIIPALIVCVMAVGRSGIICSLLLLFFYLLYKINNVKRLLLMIVVIGVLGTFFANNIADIYYEAFAKTRFVTEGMESEERELLVNTYLSNMNVKTFMFGYDYTNNPLFNFYDNNAHNSFIRLHHFMGLGFFFFIIIFFQSGIRLCLKHVFFASVFFVLLVRGTVDCIFFFERYDFILYTFCLIANKKYLYSENTIPIKI